MLKGPVLHPGLLAGLARAGHGALVLVADANYPASTARGPRSRLVHLNLRPGVVDAVTVLEAVAGQIPVEEATVMAPARSGAYALAEDPPIWSRFTRVLAEQGAPVPLQQLDRPAFYAAASTSDHVLTVVTGETEVYANLLLRVGVVRSL
jgi:L-fucose mutarotase